MFNVLQHLFTARALQKENADLTAQIAALQLKLEQLQATVQQRENEITELKKTVELLKREVEDCKKELNGPSHNTGALEPPWSEP